MRIFLILLVCALSGVSCDKLFKLQEKVKTTESASTSANNEDQETDVDKKYTGTRIQNYPNGKIKSSVQYVDGRRNGEAKNFYENGKKQGTTFYYYQDGKVYRESHYVDDKLDGLRKVYNSSGRVMAEMPYKNGYPGKGLQEFLLNGNPRTKFPSLQIRTIDDRSTSGLCHLEMSFSEMNPKDEFYVGTLLEGKYLHENLDVVNTSGGIGRITFNVPTGAYVNRKLNIIGVHMTKLGCQYVTTREYTVVVE